MTGHGSANLALQWDGRHLVDIADPVLADAEAHAVAVCGGDIDGDGRDEIVFHSMVVDDNGRGLYSTGFRHGDALHVGAFDPARPEDLEVMHVMHRKAARDERIDFFMAARSYEGEIRNCEPEKCASLDWFPLDSLPLNMIDYIRVAIEEVRNNRFYSEYGW